MIIVTKHADDYCIHHTPDDHEPTRKLREQVLPYDSPEMRKALENCEELDQQWKGLEEEHLNLKAAIVQERKR